MIGSYKITVPFVWLKQLKFQPSWLILNFKNAVQERLQFFLDRQDAGEILTPAERLVELAEFLSLLHLRSKFIVEQ